MTNLQNAPALVLGGMGDIGSAIARQLTTAGHAVTAVGRAQFDLSDPAAIDAYFRTDTTPYRILVHAAGVNTPCPFADQDIAAIEHTLAANLIGALRVLKHLTPHLNTGGRVLMVSSLYGFTARAGRSAYAISKHALLGAVRSLAVEWGPRGVLVNAISPGYVDTKLTRANNDAARIAQLRAGIPLGALATPDDIAAVAGFLCSAENRYITGQDIVVDGGFSVGGYYGI
jgi:3-oxoacyl-[acyl-carrier protein] reductase